MRAAKVPVWARARAYTDEVLSFWVGVLRDTDEPTPVRIEVSKLLMDRAYGKAPAIVMVEDESRPNVNIAVLGADATAALELALAGALAGSAITLDGKAVGEGGQGIASHSQTGGLSGDTEVSAEGQTAASEADIS